MIGSVRRRRTFDEFRRRGQRVQRGAVRMIYLAPTGGHLDASGEQTVAPLTPDRLERVEVAYAFGRRFGTAVERNRARRRIGHAFVQAWSRYREEREQTTSLRAAAAPPPGPDPITPVPDDRVPDDDALTGAFLLSGSRRVLVDPFTSLVDDTVSCLHRLTPAADPRPPIREP